MPVDIHPKEKISGVEIILTPACGGKSTTRPTSMRATAWCRRVVVNALSKHLECWCVAAARSTTSASRAARSSQSSKWWAMSRNPRPALPSGSGRSKYFDTEKFAIPKLKQVLRAKAVLCPNLRVTLNMSSRREGRVLYGAACISISRGIGQGEWLPAETFYGKRDIEGGSLDWAFAWVLESEHAIADSYGICSTVVAGTTNLRARRPVSDVNCEVQTSSWSVRPAQVNSRRSLRRSRHAAPHAQTRKNSCVCLGWIIVAQGVTTLNTREANERTALISAAVKCLAAALALAQFLGEILMQAAAIDHLVLLAVNSLST